MSDSSQTSSSRALSLSGSNSTKADTAEATFPLFGKLPREIRFMIWKLAATNTPRRIEVTDNHFNIPSPSTLFVNFESNMISKEVLTRLFDGQTFTGHNHQVYFCPEIDTVAFGETRNFTFPLDHIIGGPPEMAYRFPSQPECDSVKILELEEGLAMWMYNAVHFGSLDQLVLRTSFVGDNFRDCVLQEATKYYQQKFAHGNCTKIPQIIIHVEHGLPIRSSSAY